MSRSMGISRRWIVKDDKDARGADYEDPNRATIEAQLGMLTAHVDARFDQLITLMQ